MIIIGAGIAGLAAGLKLSERACKPLIIEARDYVGGRIHSVDMGGITVDMGASWIHGIGPGAYDLEGYEETMNPLYIKAKRYGIETVPTWEDEDDSEVIFKWW